MDNQFPMFRLVTMIARQISSPIASRIKESARKHPGLNRTLCARLAQVYRHGEIRCRIFALRLAGHSSETLRNVRVPEVSPEEARNLGGDLLGEIVIFILGALIVTYEVNRQQEIKAQKNRDKKEAWNRIRLTLKKLVEEVEHEQLRITEAKARLNEIIKNNKNKKGPET